MVNKFIEVIALLIDSIALFDRSWSVVSLESIEHNQRLQTTWSLD